jgi:hypothetical protein
MSDIHTHHVLVDRKRCLVRSSGPEADREAVVFVYGSPGSSEDYLDLLRQRCPSRKIASTDATNANSQTPDPASAKSARFDVRVS